MYRLLVAEEGYIKYSQQWDKAPAWPSEAMQELIFYRQLLYDQGLIGFDSTLKVGFGNISRRCKAGEQGLFLISGTQTGGVPFLTQEHFCWVTNYSLAENHLNCKGPLRASSESLTHAAAYELSPDYQAVIHIHHLGHWKRLMYTFPTSSPEVTYGTPQMAQEIKRLYQQTSFRESGFMVMGGHREGLLSIGNSLQDAYQNLQKALGHP